VLLSVHASVNHVVVLCFRDISSVCWRIFAKLLSLVLLGTEMNWLDFGVKRSNVKVTAWPNAPENFMFPRYLQHLVTDFRQTFVTGASRDRDELVAFWGQKVKCQGQSMTKCAREFYVSATCPVSVDGFCQTFVTGASRDRDELIRFWGRKFKVQSHTIAAEVHSTRRYRRVQILLVFILSFTGDLDWTGSNAFLSTQ